MSKRGDNIPKRKTDVGKADSKRDINQTALLFMDLCMERHTEK